ncbi:MAG: hypothetical protein KIT80_18380 [Chitinophagaceae bacterium]|nr:hypothetical protein [Chitinophagaceae bacterium]MCW5928893.1 hypothetical protein [Chitinophagaceae bacterium]
MHLFCQPYAKKITGYFLLVIWSVLLGVQSVHSHHEHASTAVERASEQSFFTAAYAHHPCPVCECHLTGTFQVFAADISPLLIPLKGETFQPRYITHLLSFYGNQPADRGPPAIL